MKKLGICDQNKGGCCDVTSPRRNQPCVTGAATVHQRRQEPEQRITPSESSPTRGPTSHRGWGGSTSNISHLYMPSVTSQVQVPTRKPGSHFILKKLSSRGLTTWSKDRKQGQQSVLSESVIPSSLCHLPLALTLLPSPVGHLAHFVLQVCGADARQTIIQRTTLYQTVHRCWRDRRLLLLRHIP